MRTGNDGAYDIQLLQVAAYSISAEAPGFKRTVQSGITLDASQRIKIDLMLDIGTVSEQVAVTAHGSPRQFPNQRNRRRHQESTGPRPAA